MSKKQGLISKAYRNEKGICSICIDDVWYGTYKQDCSQYEGQQVEFEYSEKQGNNGKTYFNANNVVPIAAPAATPAAVGSPAVPQTQDARQKSIVMQSSYKTAGEVLHGLIAADKVALGAKSSSFDNALGLLDKIAVHIFQNCMEPDRLLVEDEDMPGPAGEYVPHEA
jgi:hypothetical protein